MSELRRITDVLGRQIARTKWTRRMWIPAAVLIAVLVVLPFAIRLDGQPHANWEQFLGRFHPLAVHLPIGLILLVPLLEIAGKARPALREAASLVLALACAACLATFTLGYLLAYGSGESGITVSRHLWGGVILATGMLLCMLLRPLWSAQTLSQPYPILLAVVMVALIWTAHQGGSLTHGRDYLTQFMPSGLKRIANVSAVDAAVQNPDSYYARRVHPVLDARCVSCHGPDKRQGGLRLDTYEGLIRGGKSGPAVVPRDPGKSLLITRVSLSSGDKHFMPAEGRAALTADEIGRIRAWIEKGASPTLTAIAGPNTFEASPEPPLQPVGDYGALMTAIRQMQQSQGAKLIAVSAKASDGLILETVNVGRAFDDAQLSQMLKFAPYIVEADLARTAITDASFDTLSRFTHLRALHLEGTAISGDGLAKLSSLSQLTYLNLSETKVTDSALAPLKSMPSLRHVYVFDTPAQPIVANDNDQINAGPAQ